jgi:hypothetical protein
MAEAAEHIVIETPGWFRRTMKINPADHGGVDRGGLKTASYSRMDSNRVRRTSLVQRECVETAHITDEHVETVILVNRCFNIARLLSIEDDGHPGTWVQVSRLWQCSQ